MKRYAIRLVLCLLLGAIINVAVAWALRLAASEEWTPVCMLEWPRDEPSKRSRYADAGVCVWHSRGSERFSVLFADYAGAWWEVQNLEALVPSWADAFLDDNALGDLRQSWGQRVIEASGWPYLGLSGSYVGDWTQNPNTGVIVRTEWALLLPPKHAWGRRVQDSRILPLRPIWPGFVINTTFYVAVLWLLFTAPGFVRRRVRRSRGRCLHCGYDLRGQPPDSKKCPECGRSAIRALPDA